MFVSEAQQVDADHLDPQRLDPAHADPQRPDRAPADPGQAGEFDVAVCDVGQWLVDHRLDIDRAEAHWLERLSEFDRDQLWVLDGQLSCCSWLMWRTRMARSTAFEKLRVAHEIFRRPIIAEAFRCGVLSYSAVRVITRMDHPNADVDQAIVDLASSDRATLTDIERVVRSYELYASQERAPIDAAPQRRDVRIRRGDRGTGQVIITLSDLEIAEFAAALQAFVDLRYRPGDPVDESPGVDTGSGDPVDESPRVDTEAPMEEAGRAARAADAFMDLVGAAIAAADDTHAAGDDRYLVHFVTRDAGRTMALADGTPIEPREVAAVACDSSRVIHTVDDHGEPLELGRRTRSWSTAQRRAIRVRDAGHCRFPGCRFTYVDIHHIQPWEHGGPTDIANGCYQCRRHHRMIHAGYRIEGDPNRELRFYRPGGTYIGSTYPSEAATTLRTLTGAVLRSWQPQAQ